MSHRTAIGASFREERAPRVLSGSTHGARGSGRPFEVIPGGSITDSETPPDLGFEGSGCFAGHKATSARVKCRTVATKKRLENAGSAIA
jgi:hypothetical protein